MQTYETRILHDSRSIQWDHTYPYQFFIIIFSTRSNSLCVNFEVLAPWRFKSEYTIFAFNRHFTFSSTFRWAWAREWIFSNLAHFRWWHNNVNKTLPNEWNSSENSSNLLILPFNYHIIIYRAKLMLTFSLRSNSYYTILGYNQLSSIDVALCCYFD